MEVNVRLEVGVYSQDRLTDTVLKSQINCSHVIVNRQCYNPDKQ